MCTFRIVYLFLSEYYCLIKKTLIFLFKSFFTAYTVHTYTNRIIFLSLLPSICLFHSLSVFQIPHGGILVSNAMMKITRCSQQKFAATRHNLDPISII